MKIIHFSKEGTRLTHFTPTFHFYTAWQHEKIRGFLTLSERKMKIWLEMASITLISSAERYLRLIFKQQVLFKWHRKTCQVTLLPFLIWYWLDNSNPYQALFLGGNSIKDMVSNTLRINHFQPNLITQT